jgi:hypothetical protein
LVDSLATYPERFAQEALGHNSKVVHRAYESKKLRVRKRVGFVCALSHAQTGLRLNCCFASV